MIVVDTSVWVDFLRGANSPERRALHRLIEDEEDIAVTEIIVAEILQGIKDDKFFRTMKDYLLDMPVYRASGVDTYIKAAEIYRDCRRKGKTVRKTIDCIIAAICIENNLAILHKDRDFDIIEEYAGLKVLKAYP